MNEELAFWDKELSLKGAFAEFTKKRVDPHLRKEEFPGLIFESVIPLLERNLGAKKPFKCIELGSGPLSNLAYGVDTGLLDVTAVDVLADEFKELYRKYVLLDFPIKPIQGSGETLLSLFEKESFHCAFVRNALDHTKDIILSFANLVSLTKKNGFIIMQHFVREGSQNNWSGDHQWDLELNENGLVAFDSKGQEYSLQKKCNLELVYVYYRSLELDRWMDIVFKKL